MRRFAKFGVMGCAAVIGLLSCAERGPTEVGGSPDARLALSPLLLVTGETTTVSALLPDAEEPDDVVRRFRWFTSEPSVVSFTDDTLLVSHAEGTAEISASLFSSRSRTIVQVLRGGGGEVASISVTLRRNGVQVGDTTRALAVLRNASGSELVGRAVSWSSSNSAVAVITQSGRVRARAVGTTLISASRRGVSGGVVLIVGTPPVASISISLIQATVAAGDSTIATAIARDARGVVLTGRSVSWRSERPAVATVSSDGVVRSLTPGSAPITGTIDSVTGAAALTVTPVPPAAVSSVSVSLNASALTSGESTQAAAVTRDAGGIVLAGRTIAWKSNDTAVATVSASGLVTAVAAGSASITATSEGQAGSAAVTIAAPALAPVASVSVSLNSASLTVGQSTQATAIARDISGAVLTSRIITWSSDNAAIATVSASGTVTSVSAGSAAITATSEGLRGSAPIIVTTPPPAPVASVTVSLSAVSVVVGQTLQATALTRDATGGVLAGRAITWNSDDTTVAAASSSGLVTAVRAGSAIIRATSEGQSGGAAVQIVVVPTQLAVDVQPAGAVSGLALNTPPVVQVRDDAGSLVTTSNAAVTVAIVSGTGALVGTTTVAAVNGAARFAGLRIDGAGPHTLAFSAPGLTGAASSSVTVTQTPAALAIQTQPSGATSGSTLETQPIVRIVDNAGLLIASSSLVVTSSIESGAGTLTGSSATALTGVAAFTNLRVDATGSVTLAFSTSAPALRATSAAFPVAVGAATQLTLTTAPPSAATSGVALTPQPAVQLRDAGGVAVAQAGVVVQAAIASGGGTLSGSTSATTTGSGVATFTGLTITGTDGPRTLRFTAPAASPAVTGVTSGAITVTTPPPPPPPAPGEPTYSSTTGTLVYQDNMESYSTATAMGSTALSGARIVPVPSPYTNSVPVETNHNEVISTGRTGKALRMIYTGEYQWGSDFATVLTTPQADTATHYFQYWARVTFAAPLTSPLSVKWFMAWHRQLDRIQWNTHWPARAHTQATRSTIWQVYDQGRETSGQGDQPVGPYFDQVTDAQWHRYTYAYRVNSAPGRRDGFAQMWVDGVKMIDISAATIGVTPPGGTKPWCLAEDVDALAVNEGIAAIRWGAPQTTTSPAWTYDVDDVLWWVKQ